LPNRAFFLGLVNGRSAHIRHPDTGLSAEGADEEAVYVPFVSFVLYEGIECVKKTI
jgi:hypothetical protein